MTDPLGFRPLGWRDDEPGGRGENDKYHALRLKLARELLMPAAISGERWATLRMLHLISEAVADRCRLPQDIADWFGPALHKISCGDAVEEAFSIPRRKRGEGKEGVVRVERGRRYMMAYHVEVLRAEDRQKREVAFRMVAEAYGIGVDAVKAAYQDHKQSVKREIALERETLGKVMRISLPPK